MATSKDVAKLAGVSHTTVSRAFRGNCSIKSDTYEKVMQAAKRLNYSPNTIAASLRGQKTHTIGLVIQNPHVKLFIDLAHELDRELKNHQYRMLVSFADYDPALTYQSVKAMVEAKVDSIVYMPTYPDFFQGNMRWLTDSNVQLLQIINAQRSEYSSFVFNDTDGTRIGMQHLLDNGHTRILMLGGENRVEGYYTAYREAGMEPPIPYESLEGLDRKSTRHKIRSLLETHKPTAVFSISDDMSILTYGVFHEMGLRIPDDISFLTFDDTTWAESLCISTIGHPVHAMARAIVRQILDYNEDTEQEYASSSIVSFRPYLIERKSVCRLTERETEK